MSEKFSQMIEAEVDRRLETEAELRAEKERQEKEMLLLEKEQVFISEIYSNLKGNSVMILRIVSPPCRRTCFYNTKYTFG